MGHGLSCSRPTHEQEFFGAIKAGDLEAVESSLRRHPAMLHHHINVLHSFSAAHIAAANGRVEILSMLLDKSVDPNVLSRGKQTPLMLAAMHGKISCVERILQAGANILVFDSLRGRTCLHYAASHGHSDCLQAILSAARLNSVAASWGFARFVNVRDDEGATPLHLAARRRRPECVHILLNNGALVSASTDAYGYPGSTPLHLAARSGCLDSVRELLAWGADRLQLDASGRIPYAVALKRKHVACAALLNPSSAEPLVWPSPLKFISELNPEAKTLLEAALMEANMEREKQILKGSAYSSSSPVHSDDGIDDISSEDSNTGLCCICFEQVCSVEVQDCGHQMCAHCMISLCCHKKPDPVTLCFPAPVCPFCRSNIARLVVAKTKINEESENDNTAKQRSRRSRNFSEGSSSFKGLSSAMGSFSRMGRGSGRIGNDNDMIDKT